MGHYDCKGCDQRDCICPPEKPDRRKVTKSVGWRIDENFEIKQTPYEFFEDEPELIWYSGLGFQGLIRHMRKIPPPFFKTLEEAEKGLVGICKSEIQNLTQIIAKYEKT